MTRILIVDDHEIVREGIRTLLGRSRPDWEICGEARDGEEAIRLASELKPSVVILDVTMPTMSGLDAAPHIVHAHGGCPVLIFTMHDSERFVAEVQRIGAQGYVLKSQASRDLVKAIEAILAGGTFFPSRSDSPSQLKDMSQSDASASLPQPRRAAERAVH